MSKNSLLLHVCCGPCATAPVKMLASKFKVTGFFYNPNIWPESEKSLRLKNAKDFFDFSKEVLVSEDDDYSLYLQSVKGSEDNEQNKRCKKCYLLRLLKTAEKAKNEGYDFFTTTLLISPYQSTEDLREVGESLAKKIGVDFYFEDFRSLFGESRVISKELNLYRQKYCGCSFSNK